MHRTTLAVTVGMFVLAVAEPCGAADLARPIYRKAPVYQTFVPPFTWSGFYVGINAGYGFGDSTLSGAGASTTVHPDGALLGPTIGYNFQAGSAVYGIEGDIDYSWMRKTADATGPCPSCEVRNNYIATIRGRLGWAFDRWLPYVTGGVAFGDIQFEAPGGGSAFTDKVGWTVGGGVEYAFVASHWSTKLEYQYVDLGSASCDAAHCGTATDADFKANTIRWGVNYRY